MTAIFTFVKLLEKMKGIGAARPPRPEWRVITLTTLGASLAIALLGWRAAPSP